MFETFIPPRSVPSEEYASTSAENVIPPPSGTIEATAKLTWVSVARGAKGKLRVDAPRAAIVPQSHNRQLSRQPWSEHVFGVRADNRNDVWIPRKYVERVKNAICHIWKSWNVAIEHSDGAVCRNRNPVARAAEVGTPLNKIRKGRAQLDAQRLRRRVCHRDLCNPVAGGTRADDDKSDGRCGCGHPSCSSDVKDHKKM
jgi:hypothetical protein